MEPRIRRSLLSLALSAARALPVGMLRSADQRLHGSRPGRCLLNRIWTAVGDQPTVVPGGRLREHRPVVLGELHHDVTDPRRTAITSLLHGAGYDEHLVEDRGGSMPHLLALPRDMRSSGIRA